MCPNKHGNSVTILNYSTSAWLAGTQPLHTFILQPSWAEVDKLNIVTEFPCVLGLTVQYSVQKPNIWEKNTSFHSFKFGFFSIEKNLLYLDIVRLYVYVIVIRIYDKLLIFRKSQTNKKWFSTKEFPGFPA